MATELSMICDGHYELNSSEAQQCINVFSASLLGLGSEALRTNKGIKVSAGENFQYTKPKWCGGIYIFEAGLNPLHVKSISGNIHIYLTCKGQTICLGALSSVHPKIQLDVMMSGNFQLSHSGSRKTVYFNACEFKPRANNDMLFRTNRKLWVATVKPLEQASFNPIADKKKYHLLKVFSTSDKRENIDLFVRHNDQVEKIGALTLEDTTVRCNFECDSDFKLSHTSEVSEVLFYGYTTPYENTSFELKELPVVPSHKFDLKPPKRPNDPEYSTFKKVIAKKSAKQARKEGREPERDGSKHQIVKLTTVTLMPAPVIHVPV